METKVCSKCKEEKNISYFSKNKNRKIGVKSACKECSNKLTRAYLRTDVSSICLVCKGKRITAGKYKWKYKDEIK